jgi:hypothetical protein
MVAVYRREIALVNGGLVGNEAGIDLLLEMSVASPASDGIE